jgi:hypothetical protein
MTQKKSTKEAKQESAAKPASNEGFLNFLQELASQKELPPEVKQFQEGVDKMTNTITENIRKLDGADGIEISHATARFYYNAASSKESPDKKHNSCVVVYTLGLNMKEDEIASFIAGRSADLIDDISHRVVKR